MRLWRTLFAVRAEAVRIDAARVVRVAIVGAPNAGKSTLINNIVERHTCAASNKVHTTKSLCRAICVSDNTQIIFLDTPGIVTESETKKYNLQKSMDAAYSSLQEADIIGVIHDISNPYLRNSLDKTIINILQKNDTIPSFLVLNKIDILKSKRVLLDLVRLLCCNKIAGNTISKSTKPPNDASSSRGYDGFSDTFMISALESDGVSSIKDYLIKNAKPGQWIYPENYWTDQTPEQLIIEIVRAKLLDYLPQEIPYKLVTELEFFENNNDKLTCAVIVNCPTDRIIKFVSGAGGGKLHQISNSIRNDLTNMFQKSVLFSINLKASKKLVK